ncbi:alpha/beta fold hydrolase [Dyella solisilvae]|uniref:Alpha/beta fold hydrolase n=1 Tax=Dyella solisilvae TaxID=1920168 RepID=A0A370KBF6_9GAMM|nr:alpha/beta fold hydrolase [Dyella solisilvae]RDI99988.1 alpha/beta fold hydrolase [Dyella solisilvae]
MSGLRKLWFIVGLLAASAAQATPEVCAQRAAEILQALQKGDFALVATHFNARMKDALDASRLEKVWTQALPQQFGAFDHAADTKVSLLGDGALAETPLHFANQWLVMRVGCDAQGQVDGLRFAPGAAPAGAEAMGPGERSLAVPTPWGPLPGVLTLPSGQGPFAAVVLVAGSGPNDRDETVGANKPFRDIAQGLAAAGIASLRYDKRSRVYGPRMAQQADAATIDNEVTDDALAAVKLLSVQPGVDPHRVFVLGHSLGAYMAPRIGQREPQLAGLVLLAASARPLLDVIAQQTREQGKLQGLSDEQIQQKEQSIAAEQRWLATADPSRPPPGSFGNAPQGYWLSLREYDAVAVAGALSMPMLILQGGSDFQVSPTQDYGRWQTGLAGRSLVSFHQYEGLNHLFMPAGKTGTPADYQTPSRVDGRVIQDIAKWIKAQPAAH